MQCPKCGSVLIEKRDNEYQCLMRNCMCYFIMQGNRYYVRVLNYNGVKY